MVATNLSDYDESRRPIRFDQLLGNEGQIGRLTNAIALGRFPRLIFITGPTGCGKTTLARVVATSALCSGRPLGSVEPCGVCSNCRTLLCDSTALLDYEEIDAIKLTDEYIDDLKFELRHEEKVFFIDELQDGSARHVKLLRNVVEDKNALVIFATTHPDSIEDAVRNRLKSYEYRLNRPMTPDVVPYFLRQFGKLRLSYEREDQLERVARELHCEMRPCVEFPYKVMLESDGKLTDAYLDLIFGKDDNGSPSPTNRRNRKF